MKEHLKFSYPFMLSLAVTYTQKHGCEINSTYLRMLVIPSIKTTMIGKNKAGVHIRFNACLVDGSQVRNLNVCVTTQHRSCIYNMPYVKILSLEQSCRIIFAELSDLISW